jgi:hypothetical protein
VQVIARNATARRTERINLPLRREVFAKPESENIETESYQALVHMDTCDLQCNNRSINDMYITVLVLRILPYPYYVYVSTSTEYHLVLVVLSTGRNQSSVYVIIRRAAARSPEGLNLSLRRPRLVVRNAFFPESAGPSLGGATRL